MNMSSGYLFAKGITAGEVPHLSDNVLFEDGRFNSDYVPSGFDFLNNTYELDSASHIYPGTEGTFPSDLLGTNKVIKGCCFDESSTPGEDWTIEEGYITYNHDAETVTASRYPHKWIFIPVVNIGNIFGNSANPIIIVYRCFQENTSYKKQLSWYAFNIQSGATKMTSNGAGSLIETYASLDDWQDNDSSYRMGLSSRYTYNDFCYIAFHIYMYEYAGNPRGIKFQIKKIYVDR